MAYESARIRVGADETRITAEALAAVAKRGGVYQRAGILVEPRLDPARKLPGLLRECEEMRLVQVKGPRMRSILAEAADFLRLSRDGDEQHVNVPDWLPQAVLSLPDWPGIPVVESVAENPTLRYDGTIHDKPGYDARTGNYFNADGYVFPQVPDHPTREDARAAFDTLLDPFCDFPFVSDTDRSVVAAAILTMLARPAIPGPTPPFVIRTPTPRTGKDLLTDAMTLIGTGRQAPGRSLPSDDVELKKLLLSIGLSGARVVSFGNCEGGIGSPTLSHAVTRETLSDRKLGVNEDVTVPIRCVFLFNGNNPYFKGDFAPRVVQCSMDAGVEDPQSRSGWKYSPLLEHVRRERGNLVRAGLTILRAYCAAGKPSHGRSRKGSFERWDDLVRGALVWTGVSDPLAGDKDVRAESDADIETLATLLYAWRKAFGSRAVTLREAVDLSQPLGLVPISGGQLGAKLSDEARKELAAAFAALDHRLGDRYTSASLRYAIRHHRGRPVDIAPPGGPADIVCLDIDKERTGPAKVATWCVRSAAERAAAQVTQAPPIVPPALPTVPPPLSAHAASTPPPIAIVK